jgi:cytochrome c biogenesis protein CcmG, thiol:disulfide interchange protein DsbE
MNKDRRAVLRRLRRLGAAVAATAAVVVEAGCVGGAGETGGPLGDTTRQGKDELVGNPAPNFTARAVRSRETLSLKALRGQVVLVDFWGTFCDPCRKSFPKLQALSDKYSGQGFKVVGISEDEPDDKDKIAGFADNLGAKFSLAWDENKSIAHSYKPETMPTSFLIDKRGVVRYAHVGYHDGEEIELEREIQELLAK